MRTNLKLLAAKNGKVPLTNSFAVHITHYYTVDLMKSRSKRNRKRPRGGIGCLVGDGSDALSSKSALLRIETVPLSKAFDIIIGNTDANTSYTTADKADVNDDRQQKKMSDNHRNKRVRIIYPYPFTFATFAKARWIGRTVVDVYHDEFGKRNVWIVYNIYNIYFVVCSNVPCITCSHNLYYSFLS